MISRDDPQTTFRFYLNFMRKAVLFGVPFSGHVHIIHPQARLRCCPNRARVEVWDNKGKVLDMTVYRSSWFVTAFKKKRCLAALSALP